MTSPLKTHESIMNYMPVEINQDSDAIDLNMPLLKHLEWNTILWKIEVQIEDNSSLSVYAD